MERGLCKCTQLRTLEEALKDADVFIGLSVKGAVTKRWL